MTFREKILATAEETVRSGRFLQELKTAVSYQTESGSSKGRDALDAYLNEVLSVSLEDLGCSVLRYDTWNGSDNSFLIGRGSRTRSCRHFFAMATRSGGRARRRLGGKPRPLGSVGGGRTLVRQRHRRQ